MFKYLFALLIAPLLRPVLNAVLILLAIAFAVTIPARLWVLYVDPRPSDHLISMLNVATFALVSCVTVTWHVRRRHVVRRSYLARKRAGQQAGARRTRF
jgi:hypothetical protein